MIVYGKNGKAVNCSKGPSCQRHGAGSTYTTSVRNLDIANMPTPKPTVEELKSFTKPVATVTPQKDFNMYKDDIRVTVGKGANRQAYTSQHVEYFTGDTPLKVVEPVQEKEVSALLNHADGDTDGSIRGVYLELFNTTPDKTYDVVGPEDGTPLVVIVNTGTPRLNLVSGNIIVKPHSAWSDNKISVGGNVKAVILAGFDSSVNVKAERNANVRIVPSPGAWGMVSSDSDARVEIDKNETRHAIQSERTTVLKN